LLVTKLSSDATYVRRVLLDFDTETTIPAGSAIQSATLTLTVHSGGPQPLRTIGVYPVTRGFTASEATWDVATATTPWTAPDGDLGPRAATAAVPDTRVALVVHAEDHQLARLRELEDTKDTKVALARH
jgi:hypothetical protein